MRNPAARRTASCVVASLGVVTLASTFFLNRGRSPVEGAWFAIVIASFFVTLFAMVGVLVFHVHVRGHQRLKRGDKRLAQWTLSPVEWEQFRANDKVWREAGRPNSLSLRKTVIAGDVEVIIAQDALVVDDDFYSLGALRGLQWIPETPASLEYNMVTHSKNGTIKWNIRLPVPADAEPKARAVWDYVHRPVSSNSERTIRRFQFFRSAGLVCTALSAFAVMLTRGYFANFVQSPMAWVFIAGLVGLPSGLFLAALCHWQLGRFKRTSSMS